MIRLSRLMECLLLLGAGCVVPSLDDLCPKEVILAYPDEDGDGHGAAGAEGRLVCGRVPKGYSTVADDCDDRPGVGVLVHPGVAEVCDGVDNDCDGLTDEGLMRDFYADRDGDGVGAGDAVSACVPPPAHVALAGDCDDNDAERGPGRFEVLDGKDNNCSGTTDEALFSAGESHAVALRQDGTLLAWGCNDWGVLGDGTTLSREVPAAVPGLTRVIAVAAGRYHTVALSQDGTVWTWGNNEWGQLGLGEAAPTTRGPTQVPGLAEVTAISVGLAHSVALRRDGTVWAWGHNVNGEVGDGSNVNRFSPVQVIGVSNVVAVAAGAIHTVALQRGGTVWSWGFNGNGQLGDSTGENRSVPGRVWGLTEAKTVDSHGDHTVALMRDGTVWAWGRNNWGQLGDGTATLRLTPVQVAIPEGVFAVFGGGDHTVALGRDGSVWAWGSNERGQLGIGTASGSRMPVRVYGIGEVVSIAAGWSNTLAVQRDGTFWAWGRNQCGQIGDGTMLDRTVPTSVPILDYSMGD